MYKEFPEREQQGEHLIRTFTRPSCYPLTDYKAVQEIILSKLSSSEEYTLDDFIGCSYKNEYYPIEDARNIGFPVIDIAKYTNDFPGRYLDIPINQSHSSHYSYADFNRFSEKTNIDSKLTTTTNVNILKVFSLSSENTFTDIFNNYSFNSQKSVFGESTVSYYANKYSISLPYSLYNRIVGKYLSEAFLEYLYNSTPDELFESFGCFVLTQFISGANATALFTATEYDTLSVSQRETNMDLLISATVSAGDIFSESISFGRNSSTSNNDTIVHNFNENAFSIHTYGGNAYYNMFTPPKDVNDICFDLSSWTTSLSNEETHTIAHIPENSLIPLYEFIEEENLKNKFINVMQRGYSIESTLQEPYLYIDIILYTDITTRELIAKCQSYLYTRYNDAILLSKLELRNPDSGIINLYINYECNRLRKEFPGLGITTSDIQYPRPEIIIEHEVPTISILNPIFTVNTTDVDMNLKKMKKYTDINTGKIYLIPEEDCNFDTVFTIYGNNVINDYTLSNTINNMQPIKSDIDLETLKQKYTLVAL